MDGDDFTTQPVETMTKIETFIGVEHYFTADHFDFSGRKGYPCFKLDPESHSSCMSKAKAREHPELKEESLEILRKHFRPILERFRQQTGLDLQLL